MIVYLLFLFVLGTAIGSFLNVVIDRLPKEESVNGRSHCDHCKHTLQPLDLIPVWSFAFLGGKCRYCGRKLKLQYPAIEALTGFIFVLVYFFKFQTLNIELFLYLGLISCMIAIFFTDIREQIIPDELQIAFLIFAALLKVMQGASLIDIGFAAVAGGVVMLPILLMHFFTKGRGMGFGDVKLSFNIGFFLGWFRGFLVLYLGFILGAGVGVILLATRLKKMKSKIAFGPFLILGIFTLIFFENYILAFIKKIYGY